ncbi:hypothetical protein AGMMS49579_19400 [Spirochaetia bacterium]|nr:hypothetical protein AGMMS49579_19400 [Spirochaetia bacterium]
MGKILYYLPPLSPDYSGVASVFHDLGALTVIHDASGCTGTYTGYDEPRWFGSKSPTFCSGLREMDAIMGDDEKLLKKIEAALVHINAPCVVIIGSPVPMVVGFDFTGFAALVEKRTGLPCFAFPATGLAYYDTGQKAAYLAIAKKFLNAGEGGILPNTVNILGASVLDGFDDGKLDSLIALLHGEGLHTGAVWGMRSSLEGLRQTPQAAVNWVVTAAALPLAQHLREQFGTPFVAGLPLGDQETRRIITGLRAANNTEGESAAVTGTANSDGAANPAANQFPPGGEFSGGNDMRVLLTGEGLFCASLRAQMEAEQGLAAVRIGSFFTEARAVFNAGDIVFTSEDSLTNVLAHDGLELVAGDPLFRDLLPPDSPARFIEIPHRAVSGRLYA